ncbi:putative Amino acid transporter [Giardia muris]|uniref:Putative Amino acid transporter n=1 Tax=Giardia muris TaxID=5742 RepID=A0A4Z1SSB6_GIAMU|nr:putative Amino acid transporter [Giardia muris]|eukprot:TNJ28774.1 putative Amino acid transporter [Giardia muris]
MPCRKRKEEAQATACYSWPVMVGVALNFIIGTGCLSLSKTTGNVSVVVTLLTTTAACFLVIAYGLCFPDLLARSFALLRAGWGPEKLRDRVLLPNSESAGVKNGGETCMNTSTSLQSQDIMRTENAGLGVGQYSDPNYEISTEIELRGSELAQMYLGQGGFYVYQIMNIIYLFTALWSYGSVIGSSLASVVPFTLLPDYKKNGPNDGSWSCENASKPGYPEYCVQAYAIWVCICMVTSCILIFVDLARQKIVQTFFTICRFVALALVIIFTAVAWVQSPTFTSYDGRKSVTPIVPGTEPVVGVSALASTGGQMSSIIFCQMCHQAYPGIIRPVKREHHKRLNLALYLTYVFTGLITVIFLFFCGTYLGPYSQAPATLNFKNWTGRKGDTWITQNTQNLTQEGYAKAISIIILILPPVYLFASVPNNAMTLAANIITFFPLRLQKKLYVVIPINLLSIIPALVLSIVVRDFGTIIDFGGLTGFAILILIGVMQLRSMKICKKVFAADKQKTIHTNCFHSVPLLVTAFVVCGIGCLMAIFSLLVTAIGER